MSGFICALAAYSAARRRPPDSVTRQVLTFGKHVFGKSGTPGLNECPYNTSPACRALHLLLPLVLTSGNRTRSVSVGTKQAAE